jgi:hypothetical protein
VGELIGDAELKMDWTEPPAELNSMGIDSGFLIFGDAQIVRRRDCRGVLWSMCGGEGVLLDSCGDGNEEQRRSRAGCQAAPSLGGSRSDCGQRVWSRQIGFHEVSRMSGGGRAICLTINMRPRQQSGH